ncbi:MAG TPA: MBL fold metallo-hydrolase [Polyangiaceae bacterium]|jgi:glyoxylase-like metal-dependent hydrolase (beta-lactamase superfamily II)/ferredoxin
MAHADRRFAENSPGDWFVDDSCIDCAACRHIAPSVFAASSRGFSYVGHQPSDAERERAAMALVACPTSSIGGGDAALVRRAAAAFPAPVLGGRGFFAECGAETDVWYCGYHSASSYGAASYLIRRPGGNVLVDSPRAAKPLMSRLESLGGVKYMFLTHRDDVADHAAFRDRFGCERILHDADVSSGTRDVERKVRDSEPVVLAEDLQMIPVPGHTRGSMALLYRDEFLFTGDHLSYDAGESALDAHPNVCWYSWKEQVRSVERLIDYSFRWVLPGHGDPYEAPTNAAMREMLSAWLQSQRR